MQCGGMLGLWCGGRLGVLGVVVACRVGSRIPLRLAVVRWLVWDFL